MLTPPQRVLERAHRRCQRWLEWLAERILAHGYIAQGRRMGAWGYSGYKIRELRRALTSTSVLTAFAGRLSLPEGFGVGLDERIVEYPWVLSRLRPGPARLLDAGSTFNFEWIACVPPLRSKAVVVYTLAPEGVLERGDYSYVYGDLRSTILREGWFDVVVCVSTLEHVGMDNTMFYTSDPRYREAAPHAYREVMREFKRVLVPGGRVLLTVPFGDYMNLGWLQQFDANLLQDLIDSFEGEVLEISYYRYSPRGWNLTSAQECVGCQYAFVVADGLPRVATARAVACVHLRSPS